MFAWKKGWRWRWHPGSRISLYLYEIFKDMPSLRPGARRWCQVSTEDDPEEGTCVVISLSIALDPKQRKKRQAGAGPEPSSP